MKPIFITTVILSALFFASAGVFLSAEETAVRLMTYNIRMSHGDVGTPDEWRFRREAVAELIRAGEYDFVGLQEVVVTPVELYDQAKFLAENLPEFGMICRSREISEENGEATPILYRRDHWELDAQEQGFFWHSETPEVPGSKSWETACTRIATWGLFHEIGGDGTRTGRRVYVLNTHLDHISTQAREKAAEQIAEFFEKKDVSAEVPVFVTGDFNAGEESAPIRFLQGKFTETFRLLHPDEKDVGTFNGFKEAGTAKIDYIFTRPEMNVREAKILRDRKNGRFPSDHFPVTAECVLGERE